MVYSEHLLGGTEESHEKLPEKIVFVQAEI
jgi:hypothetical protein